MSGGVTFFTSDPATSSTGPRSSVFVDTPNGHGGTNTTCRRFTNIRLNTGTAITYADSAANGGTWTINETGLYTIVYTDGKSTAGAERIGVTVNSAFLTTAIQDITYAQGRRAYGYATAVANEPGLCTCTVILTASDVIRAQTEGDASMNTDESYFLITKVNN